MGSPEAFLAGARVERVCAGGEPRLQNSLLGADWVSGGQYLAADSWTHRDAVHQAG